MTQISEKQLNKATAFVPEIVFDILGRLVPGSLFLVGLIWILLANDIYIPRFLRDLPASFLGQLVLIFSAYTFVQLIRPITWKFEIYVFGQQLKSVKQDFEPIVAFFNKNNDKKDLNLSGGQGLWDAYATTHYFLKVKDNSLNALLPKIVAECHLCYIIFVSTIVLELMTLALSCFNNNYSLLLKSQAILLPILILSYWSSSWKARDLLKRHADYFNLLKK